MRKKIYRKKQNNFFFREHNKIFLIEFLKIKFSKFSKITYMTLIYIRCSLLFKPDTMFFIIWMKKYSNGKKEHLFLFVCPWRLGLVWLANWLLHVLLLFQLHFRQSNRISRIHSYFYSRENKCHTMWSSYRTRFKLLIIVGYFDRNVWLDRFACMRMQCHNLCKQVCPILSSKQP